MVHGDPIHLTYCSLSRLTPELLQSAGIISRHIFPSSVPCFPSTSSPPSLHYISSLSSLFSALSSFSSLPSPLLPSPLLTPLPSSLSFPSLFLSLSRPLSSHILGYMMTQINFCPVDVLLSLRSSFCPFSLFLPAVRITIPCHLLPLEALVAFSDSFTKLWF